MHLVQHKRTLHIPEFECTCRRERAEFIGAELGDIRVGPSRVHLQFDNMPGAVEVVSVWKGAGRSVREDALPEEVVRTGRPAASVVCECAGRAVLLVLSALAVLYSIASENHNENNAQSVAIEYHRHLINNC